MSDTDAHHIESLAAALFAFGCASISLNTSFGCVTGQMAATGPKISS